MTILNILIALDDVSFNSIYSDAFDARGDLRDNALDSYGDERFTEEQKALITANFELAYQAKIARENRALSPDFFKMMDELSNE